MAHSDGRAAAHATEKGVINMKRLAALLLSAALIWALTACGGTGNAPANVSGDGEPESADVPDNSGNATESDRPDGDTENVSSGDTESSVLGFQSVRFGEKIALDFVEIAKKYRIPGLENCTPRMLQAEKVQEQLRTLGVEI